MDNNLFTSNCYAAQATQHTFELLKKTTTQHVGQCNGSVGKALATKVISVPATRMTEDKNY